MAENNNHQERLLSVAVDNVVVDFRSYATESSSAEKKSSLSSLFRQKRSLRTVHALKGVSLRAYEGESIGIIGKNGSGKSTLMKAIAGLTPTSDGDVYARTQPVLLSIGGALASELSGSRNVILGCLAMGLSMEEARRLYPSIVEFSGIADSIDLPMSTYSSGMSARLRFSIAACVDREILIIDEALSVGDAEFAQKSEKRIQELRQNAGTVFLVSHSMESIVNASTRVIWVDEGKIRADGEPKEVVQLYKKHRH